MSSAYLCGGLYQSEKRRSSVALAQISKEKVKYSQEEDYELAQIEECDAMSQLNVEQKIPVNNVASRRISFDFERSYDSTQLNRDAHRRQSFESESFLPDAGNPQMSRAMPQGEVTAQEPQELPSLWTRFEHLSVDPEGVIAFYWKATVTLAVLYNCILVISRMAFEELRVGVLFSVLDTVCDAIYVIDLIIEAKTSYLSDGLVVTDGRKTSKHYKQKSYFQADLLAICPTQTAALVVSGVVWILPCWGNILFEIWSYVVFWPGVRVNRLLKYHTMENFFQKTESRTNKPNVLRAFKLGTHLGLVIHWFACLYYILSEYEGLGSNEWVYPAESTQMKFSKKYITCMFWSVMTLTTIGERPPPQTEVEYIFTGLTFLIGVFVFAAVVGNVGDVISNMNAARRDFQARMDQIKFYMDHRNVPDHLQNRVKRWAEYTWDRTNCIDEPSVLQLLPDRLRTEVAIHVHLDILKKVSIFQDCEEGLLRELVLKLRPQIFSPGDYICRIGEIGRDMYIINHGKVEILFPDAGTGIMRQVSVMHPGSFFGEISLLKLDEGQNRRTADVRSLGFSELFCLSRRDLIVALTEYPEAKKILEDYGRERYNNTKRTTPLESDESRPTSPRPSLTNKRSNARSVFERVMKQEGFTKLLEKATKGTEISEIKTAIEEMRAEKKSVEELENALRDKTAELLAAHAQIASLERMITAIAHAQRENDPGRNIDNTLRPERSNLNGLNLTPRWPDLVPVNSQHSESNLGERSLPKTSLHARGYLKEVPTSYAERLSKQSAKFGGKLFGPLFVGSRRHIRDDSVNLQRNASSLLIKRGSSPALCTPTKNTVRLRPTDQECRSKTQNGLGDQMQPNTRSSKVNLIRSLNTNGQSITLDQGFRKSENEVAPERLISEASSASSLGKKVEAHLQPKISGYQNSKTRLLEPRSLQKYHLFYPSVCHPVNLPMQPSAAATYERGGCERLKPEESSKHASFQTSEPIRKNDQFVKGTVNSFREENCDETNMLRTQTKVKTKTASFSDCQLTETASSVAPKISLTVPPLCSSPRASKSNPTVADTTAKNEKSFLRDYGQSLPYEKSVRSSFSKASSSCSGTASLSNSLEVPMVKEQRRPSISLSLILDNLSFLDSSDSENDEDYESDDEDVSDDYKV